MHVYNNIIYNYGTTTTNEECIYLQVSILISIHEHVSSLSMSIILKLYIGIDVRTCEVQDASKVQEGNQEFHLFMDISRFCEEHFEKI